MGRDLERLEEDANRASVKRAIDKHIAERWIDVDLDCEGRWSQPQEIV
jgi:hypothetical protein